MNKEEKVGNNILVIGNGFDLAHGLPTKYNDFMVAIKKCKSLKINPEAKPDSKETYINTMKLVAEQNGFIKYFLDYTNEVPGWIDLERLIKDIIEYFKLFFDSY